MAGPGRPAPPAGPVTATPDCGDKSRPGVNGDGMGSMILACAARCLSGALAIVVATSVFSPRSGLTCTDRLLCTKLPESQLM